MKLHKIQGGNIGDLEDKKYNIGVGISIGNKWFTPENIAEATRWSLRYAREDVVIYVSDSIHSINLEVRNKVSRERAIRIAKTKGEEILMKAKLEIEKLLDTKDLDRVHFAHWKDLLNDEYKKKTAYLYSLYEENEEFRKNIHLLVENHTTKEERQFTKEDIHSLGTYIIEELPEVLCRVPIGGKVYDAYIYPFDGELTRFIENIQNGKIFPEIKENIIDTEPKVFLEVR